MARFRTPSIPLSADAQMFRILFAYLFWISALVGRVRGLVPIVVGGRQYGRVAVRQCPIRHRVFVGHPVVVGTDARGVRTCPTAGLLVLPTTNLLAFAHWARPIQQAVARIPDVNYPHE